MGRGFGRTKPHPNPYPGGWAGASFRIIIRRGTFGGTKPIIMPTKEIVFKFGRKRKKVAVPQSWDDLDERRLLLYYGLLFSEQVGPISGTAFTALHLISIFRDTAGLEVADLEAWEADCRKADPELGGAIFLEELKIAVTAMLGGLFEITDNEDGGGTSYAVRFNRTKNPWPEMTSYKDGPQVGRKRGKGQKVRWLFAPKDGLANLTLYEMAYTFSVYEAYVRTANESLVHQLIGALYRPSRPETREERESAWHGDRRQPLRRYEDMVEKRAKLAATLPATVKRVIVFWFAGCRERIVTQYPKVFKRSEDAKIGENAYGWGGLLLRLAETGTLGNLGETSDQHYSNGLTFLSMKEDERVALEQRTEELKRKGRR